MTVTLDDVEFKAVLGFEELRPIVDFRQNSGWCSCAPALLLGAGAKIDLSQGCNAKLEWERYSAVDRLNRNIFSASFEYKF